MFIASEKLSSVVLNYRPSPGLPLWNVGQHARALAEWAQLGAGAGRVEAGPPSLSQPCVVASCVLSQAGPSTSHLLTRGRSEPGPGPCWACLASVQGCGVSRSVVCWIPTHPPGPPWFAVEELRPCPALGTRHAARSTASRAWNGCQDCRLMPVGLGVGLAVLGTLSCAQGFLLALRNHSRQGLVGPLGFVGN